LQISWTFPVAVEFGACMGGDLWEDWRTVPPKFEVAGTANASAPPQYFEK